MIYVICMTFTSTSKQFTNDSTIHCFNKENKKSFAEKI